MPWRAGPSYWSRLAGTYDEEADHGLGPADVRRAWKDKLTAWLPGERCDAADLGCGTGSLSILAAELGHRVTGIDFADAMIERAQEKAYDAGVKVRFVVGDAATPPLPDGSVDVVLVRHVLWALPDPAAALARWRDALRPGGRFVLVEGAWSTGAGMPASKVAELLTPYVDTAVVERLDEPALWGEEIDDERYVVRGVLP